MSKYLDTSGLEEVSDIVSDRLSTKVDKITGKGLSEANFTTAEKQKLAEIDLSNYIQLSQKGTTNGVATLDSNGKVPSFQLPDDNIVGGYYDTTSQKFYKESTYNTKTTGDSSKLYVDLNSSKVYRWNGTVWIDVASTLTLGIGSTNAYPGDLGNANAVAINNLASSIGDLSELDTVDKSNVVSAINEKQAALTFDGTPTEGSNNPVTSGGVYEAIKDMCCCKMVFCTNDGRYHKFNYKIIQSTRASMLVLAGNQNGAPKIISVSTDGYISDSGSSVAGGANGYSQATIDSGSGAWAPLFIFYNPKCVEIVAPW